MTDLPTELQLQIMRYCSLESLLALGCTCKQLYETHSDPLSPQLHALFLSHRRKEGLVRYAIPPCPINGLVARFEGVSFVVLGVTRAEVSGCLNVIGRGWKGISSLEIYATDLDSLVPAVTKERQETGVQDLALSNDVRGMWTRLVIFRVRYFDDGDDLVLRYIRKMPALRELELKNITYFEHPTLLHKTAKNLDSLDMDLCLNDSQLLTILAECRNLTSLKLRDCSKQTARVLQIFQSEKKIRVLHFQNGPSTLDLRTAIQTFMKWTELIELDLYGSQWIQDTTAADLITLIPSTHVVLPCGYDSLAAYSFANRNARIAQRLELRKARGDARRAWFELATIGIRDEFGDEGKELRKSGGAWRLPRLIARSQYTFCDPPFSFPPDDSDTESMI